MKAGRFWGVVLLMGLVSGLALAACGGDEGEQGTTTPEATTPSPTAVAVTPLPGAIDPCALLTKAEAEAVLGEPLGEGRKTAGVLSCTYFTEPVPTKAAGVTALLEGEGPDLETIRQAAEQAEAVPGLGDDAFWVPGQQFLWVAQGPIRFQILVFGIDEAAALEGAKGLALTVIERLP